VTTKPRMTPADRSRRTSPVGSLSVFLGRVHANVAPQRSPFNRVSLLDCHGHTEVGRRRKDNEDDFLIAALPMGQDFLLNQEPSRKSLNPLPGQTGFLFLVADGIGGIPCGERASALAVRSFYGYVEKRSRFLRTTREEIVRTLMRGITQCQSDLHAEVERFPECHGMGTTFTGVLSLSKHLYVVHSGDSRCYLLRGSRFDLVTDDHSRAQLESDAGTMDRDAARTLTGGNALWKCLTSETVTARPDIMSLPLEAGSILLLCTDGVSDALSEEEIKHHLSAQESAKSICMSLIARARPGGGGDDLTAIVARFGGSA